MILTTVPVSLRRPGVYSEFEFVENAQQLAALPNRVVVVAEAKGGTATIELPIQVFSAVDADAKFGVGTMAALACRMAFTTGKLRGSTPEIWCCPIAESAGVQMQETITVTVTTALAGTIVLRIAGRVVSVGVSAGDAQNTIAGNINAAIQAMLTTLPITSTVATNVVTAKCVTKGVNGNDIAFELVSAPGGVTVALAQTVAGTLASSIANALNALYDRRYHGIILSNHTATDTATLLTQVALDWGYTEQNYRFYFMGSRDSVGTATTLAATANDFRVNLTVCEQIPRLPVEIAAAIATDWFSYDAPNVNTDGDVLPLEPPSGAYAFTSAEIESALAAGLTPLTPSGSFVKIERLTSTEITVAGAPFEPLRDMAYPRTSAWLAEQVAIKIATGLQQQVETDDVLNDARDIIVEVDRATEKLGYIKDVDTFLDTIRAEYASTPVGRLNATNPHRVAGPLHQVVVHNTMYQ